MCIPLARESTNPIQRGKPFVLKTELQPAYLCDEAAQPRLGWWGEGAGIRRFKGAHGYLVNINSKLLVDLIDFFFFLLLDKRSNSRLLDFKCKANK